MVRNDKRPAARPPKQKGAPPRPKHGEPATLDEFERERMGVAAKE